MMNLICLILFVLDMPKSRVMFNVSGYQFETFDQTLNRYPDTLLGNPHKLQKYYDHQKHCYFLNRSQAAFEAILFYYQSQGCLARPPFLPMTVFEYECLFYELDRKAIKSMKEREGFDTLQVVPSQNKKHKLYWLWAFLEYSEASIHARLFTYLSLLCIMVTICIDCFETIPGFFYDNEKSSSYKNIKKIQLSLNTFFAVEFIARLISCPRKCHFLTSLSNIIDVLAIFPSFIILVVSNDQMGGLLFTRVLRIFRIFRLMRLSKSFKSLSIVLHIISNSLSSLFILVICMLISVILFGSLVYYTEMGAKDSQVTSIPEGMWFAMITVVSIGYGDVIPSSGMGKIAAALTAIFGAVTMTLPLLSLGGKYFSMYTKTFDVDLSETISKPTHDALREGEKLK